MAEAVLTRLVPNQAGALWIGLLIAVITFADLEHLRSRRNFALLGLLALAPLLVDMLDARGSLAWKGLTAKLVFAGIYLVTALYTAWGVWLAMRARPIAWAPRLPARVLRALLLILVGINSAVVFGRAPDDAGYYTNLGARRWTETGRLPYADEKLKGPDSPAYGAAATYGPLLYVAHLPFQWIVNAHTNPPDADPMDKTYVRPPVAATQLACFAFYLLGLWALMGIVRRAAGREVALGVGVLYAGMPYLVGLGGEAFAIGGLPYISHIAPAAVTLLAFLWFEKPVVSGALLATAAGVLFYPLFMLPPWLGWWVWNRPRHAWRFATGFALALALIAGMVAAFTPPTDGASRLDLVIESTIEHQEGTDAKEYGNSPVGFWGAFPELAAFWQKPLVAGVSLFKPTFLLFSIFAAATFFLARKRSPAQLAGLTAAIASGVQLWKTHAAGSYVEWYLPFLIIALFASASRPADGPVEANVTEPARLATASAH